MQTFNDGGRVYEISPAQDTHEVRVQLRDLYPGRSMHGSTEKMDRPERDTHSGEGGKKTAFT